MNRALTLLLALAFPLSASAAEPKTAGKIDVDRYAGTWFEIALLPAFFERGCVGTTATYRKNDDGEFTVVNRCYDGSFDGKVKRVEGKAWAPNADESAKLKVQFFWPFRSDYWVLEVGPKYEYAVVGTPDHKYGWILSRTPTMDEELYAQLVGKLKAEGYPVEKLIKVQQREK